jgi:outer membrane protein assembly factor BamB/orotate phosphoribosyltransferase
MDSPCPVEPTCWRELLLEAIRERAILRAENQRLIGPRGNANIWLIDSRRIFMEAPTLNAFAEIFFATFAPREPFQVGGIETAAIPLVAAILMKATQRGLAVNGFMVRKERKTYGTGSLIEGTLTDRPIIIVDDILNSGSSLEKVRVVLEHEHKTMTRAFVLVDYLGTGARLWQAMHGITVHAAFTLEDLGLVRGKREDAPSQRHFRTLWSFAAPDPNFFHCVPKSFPVTDGKRVYFGSDCGVFWCLDARNGAVIWQFQVNTRGHKNLWSAPALHAGRVYFGGYDGNVYCVDAASGREVWRFIGAEWVGSSPALAPELNLLFIGLEFSIEGRRGSIVALNLATGEKVWEHHTKRYTHASPAFWAERQLVACGSNDNEMLLLEAATGRLLWRFATHDEKGLPGSIRHAPAFDCARGQLVTGCANGYIYVIDIETGAEAWSVRTDNTLYTVPLVVADTAYIGSTDKCFYVLDLARREVRAKIHIGAKIFGPPRLLAGRVYFGACNGMVYELDPVTAAITGTHQLPDAVTNALCHDSETGVFYALTYVNQLYAFSMAET